MAATHDQILHDVQLAVSAEGYRAWRNNIGFWIDKNGNPIRYGLAVGSGDLIGIGPAGRFLSIEIKPPGDGPRKHQRAWLEMVRRMGGIAGVAHSVPEALDLLR